MKARLLTHPLLEGPDAKTTHRYRCCVALTKAIEQHAPRVLSDLRDSVLMPFGSVIVDIGRRPEGETEGGVWLALEQYALNLARPVFRQRKPNYDPSADVAALGARMPRYANVDQSTHDIIAAGFVEDRICEDIRTHSEAYDARCRFLGQAEQTYWSVLTAADDSFSSELVDARNAIVAWADRFNLRVFPGDVGQLYLEWFCEVACRTVVFWHRDDFDGEFERPSLHPRASSLPMCECPPLIPTGYSHSFIDCPARPRPHARLHLPHLPERDPFNCVEYDLAASRFLDTDFTNATLLRSLDAHRANEPALALLFDVFQLYPEHIEEIREFAREIAREDSAKADEHFRAFGFDPVEYQPDYDLPLCAEWWVRWQVGADDRKGKRQSYASIAGCPEGRRSTREQNAAMEEKPVVRRVDRRTVTTAIEYLFAHTGIARAQGLPHTPKRKGGKVVA